MRPTSPPAHYARPEACLRLPAASGAPQHFEKPPGLALRCRPHNRVQRRRLSPPSGLRDENNEWCRMRAAAGAQSSPVRCAAEINNLPAAFSRSSWRCHLRSRVFRPFCRQTLPCRLATPCSSVQSHCRKCRICRRHRFSAGAGGGALETMAAPAPTAKEGRAAMPAQVD